MTNHPAETPFSFRALVARDDSGSIWVYVLPSAFFLLEVVDTLLSWSAESAQWAWPGIGDVMPIGHDAPPVSVYTPIVLVVLVSYAIYPTILGWAITFVPIAGALLQRIVDASVASRLDVSWILLLSAAFFGVCSAYIRWRPKRASWPTVMLALGTSFVVGGSVLILVVVVG